MKKNTEAKIQAEIVEYLSGQEIFCHSVPNEGAGKDKLRTMQMITMGLRPGTADLVVWLPWGEIGYLEVKTEIGKLSENQRRFKKRCEENGMFYAVVRSVEDVQKILESHESSEDGAYRKDADIQRITSRERTKALSTRERGLNGKS
jgi:hypothetical protein